MSEPPKTTHAYKPSEFPVFSNPPFVEMKRLYDGIKNYLQNYKSVLGIDDKDEFAFDQNILLEILSRIEKRRVYYHIFHNKMNMGEQKIVSLFCFWVLKLMPFRCKGKPNSLVNSKIALCAFINMLYASAFIKKKDCNNNV